MRVVVSKIVLLNHTNSLKGIASIVLDEELVIHDIRIIKSENFCKYSVCFPSFIDKQNKYRNIIHPITENLRQNINEKVLAAFFNKKEQEENDK